MNPGFLIEKIEIFFIKCFSEIDKIDGKKFVIDAGPNTEIQSLVRARVFQKEAELIEALKRPDLHLSAPPSDFASKGRMNAHGISVFYGADKPEVVLAEVRPPVGSRVLSAEFKICRPIRLLNLLNTESGGVTGSVFDPAFAPLLSRIKFLGVLAKEIAQPILPANAEYEYLPTQAIADFLANENEPLLDGVIFPSSQFPDGRNFVLFNMASLVEEIDIPDGLKIDASTAYFDREDGFVRDYDVVEKIPGDLNT